MAGVTNGGKKTLSYEISGVRGESNWNPGKTGPKRRRGKGHKVREYATNKTH